MYRPCQDPLSEQSAERFGPLPLAIMMHKRMHGLQQVLDDALGLIYTPVIFRLICMYFTQYWLQSQVRIGWQHYYCTRNDALHPF